LAAAGGNVFVGLTAGTASLVGAAWMAFGVPFTPPKAVAEVRKASPFNLGLLADVPRLRPLVLIAVVAWLSLATLEGTFARLIKHLFHYDQRYFGVIFGYESILGVVVQAVLVGWVATRLRPRALLRSAYCVQGIGLGLNPFAGAFAPAIVPFVLLLAASTLYAVGAGIANPTVNSQCSRLAPEDRQGELFGLLQGPRSAGFVFGPLVGGILFDWNPAAPYVLAALVCCSAAFLVPKLDA
jgi:MFS family permease